MMWFSMIALFLAVEFAAPGAGAQELELTDQRLQEISYPAAMGDSKEFPAEPGDSDVQIAMKKFHQAAIQDLRTGYVAWLQDRGDIRCVLVSTERMFAARFELSSSKKQNEELLQEKLELAKFFERQAEAIKRNLSGPVEIPRASYRYYRDLNLKEAVAYRKQVTAEIASKADAEVEAQKEPLSPAPLFQ